MPCLLNITEKSIFVGKKENAPAERVHFLNDLKLIIEINVTELLVAESHTYDSADYGTCDSSVGRDRGVLEEKHGCDAESSGSNAERGYDNVELLEVSLYDEGEDYHGDSTDNNTYSIGLKTDNVICNLKDEGDRKEKVFYHSAEEEVTARCTYNKDSEGVILKAEQTEYNCEYKCTQIYGIDVLTYNSEVGLNKGSNICRTEISADAHTCNGKNNLQELVAILCEQNERNSRKNNNGNKDLRQSRPSTTASTNAHRYPGLMY